MLRQEENSSTHAQEKSQVADPGDGGRWICCRDVTRSECLRRRNPFRQQSVDNCNSWDTLFESLDLFSDDFMKVRTDGFQSAREKLFK